MVNLIIQLGLLINKYKAHSLNGFYIKLFLFYQILIKNKKVLKYNSFNGQSVI